MAAIPNALFSFPSHSSLSSIQTAANEMLLKHMSDYVTVLLINLPWLPIALGEGTNSSIWSTQPFKIRTYKYSHLSPYTPVRVNYWWLFSSFSLIFTLCTSNSFCLRLCLPRFLLMKEEHSYSSFMTRLRSYFPLFTLSPHIQILWTPWKRSLF